MRVTRKEEIHFRRGKFLLEKETMLKLNPDRSELYSPHMINALKEMAERDVTPDSRFSDDDCMIWSWFRKNNSSYSDT